jgi:hypothetical protein
MHRKSGYLVGFGGAVAMLSLIASLEIEVAVAHGGAEPVPVNRTLKGDRLTPNSGIQSARPLAPRAEEPKLPNECHASFNARNNAFSAEVAGRCLS